VQARFRRKRRCTYSIVSILTTDHISGHPLAGNGHQSGGRAFCLARDYVRGCSLRENGHRILLKPNPERDKTKQWRRSRLFRANFLLRLGPQGASRCDREGLNYYSLRSPRFIQGNLILECQRLKESSPRTMFPRRRRLRNIELLGSLRMLTRVE